MFDFDKPITDFDQDMLGHEYFVRSLAKAIAEESGHESYVIGLYGKWGSGKTSIINLLSRCFEGKGCKDKTSPILISFSGWGIQDEFDLLNLFSRTLTEKAKVFGKAKEKISKAAKDLSRYGAALSEFSSEIKIISALVGESLKESKSPMEIKKDIEETLEKQKRRLVVVIDDLDRMPNDQIRTVFRFVNIVADFRNVTYILPFDYDVVIEALSGVQGSDGAEYLDKIIQVPLAVPAVNTAILLELLDRNFSTLIDIERDDFSNERMSEVARSLISPFLQTVRDVKRLQNVVQFQMNILSSELNCVDITALAALLVFQPEVYRWVQFNKDLLTGIPNVFNPKKNSEMLLSSLKEVCSDSDVIANDILLSLEVLFPGISSPNIGSSGDYLRERRVCHKELFDRYFLLNLDESELITREAIALIRKGEIDALHEIINKAISNPNFSMLLEEIQAQIPLVSEETAKAILKVLFTYLGKTKERMGSGIFILATDEKLKYIIKLLLAKVKKEESGIIILDLMKKMDLENLASFAEIINSQELTFGQLAASSPNEEKQLVIFEDLQKIEGLFLEKIEEFSTEDYFLDHENLAMLMYLWSCFDEENYTKYWRSRLNSDPIFVCYLLNASAGKWISGSQEYGWTFMEVIYGKLLSQEEIIEKIQLLKDSGVFSDMDTALLLKVITFFVVNTDPNAEKDHFSVDMAKEYEKEWRKPKGPK